MKPVFLIVLSMFLWPAVAIPADPPAHGDKHSEKSIAAKGAEPTIAPATLKVQNRPIVTLRGNLFGYTPKQRVEAATARIKAHIDQGSWGPTAARPAEVSIRFLRGVHGGGRDRRTAQADCRTG